MSIRIKWSGTMWWAYFNGHESAHLHADKLEDMCNAITVLWPKGTAK